MENLAFDFSASPPDPIVLDVETQYLSHEVPGGWTAVDKLRVAVAVTWDEKNGLRVWFEQDVPALLEELKAHRPVVTFNGEGFDFKVLSAYGPVNQLYDRSADILKALIAELGFRVKLDSLALATLGRSKTGSGTESVEWWRSGDPVLKQKVVDYCKSDVELTRDLYFFGKRNGYVLVDDLRRSRRRRVPVRW
jgi:DEAD/DEAH box helicase domain-containing protein